MRRFDILTALLFGLTAMLFAQPQPAPGQNWTHYIRTSGHGLSLDRVAAIVDEAERTHIYGIEVDNSLTGYYESFLEPAEKLKAIEAVAKAAHARGNRVFVYTEGLETITSNADEKAHTFFKDHPDWVQRDITGRPAVFGGGDAFWIDEGDEDVWITPYAMQWREMYMERIRQIAATGIDGVFVDIPYWMTHFEGWGDTWASFDEYTLAAFKAVSGLNARTDVDLGNWDDPNFIQWVDFRMRSLTEFMAEVAENGRSVNPDFITIAEIYPGIEESAVRVGADVYQMYEVVDVVAHEYSAGGYTSAERSPLDWFLNQVGILSFRAFAEGKASWMLSYSWDGQEAVNIRDAQHNLMMAQLMVGANCWDARGHVMSGSNDIENRATIFKWIGEHENTFYRPRTPIAPVGLYFSPKTRNYFVDDYIPTYRGWMSLFLQRQVEVQVVTPRTLKDFAGKVLVLGDARVLSDAELMTLDSLRATGTTLVMTGECGWYDVTRTRRGGNPLLSSVEVPAKGAAVVPAKAPGVLHYPGRPGERYYRSLRAEFNGLAVGKGDVASARFTAIGDSLMNAIRPHLDGDAAVRVDAEPFLSAAIASVEGRPHVFLSNFKGLVAEQNAKQTPVKNVRVSFPEGMEGTVRVLPYLGKEKKVKAETRDGRVTVTLPAIERGMVVWLEPR